MRSHQPGPAHGLVQAYQEIIAEHDIFIGAPRLLIWFMLDLNHKSIQC
jgi:hypothetical protein